ncbi:MAG: PAS domain S-box protein [Syntrophobacteraceae bacterium]
MVQAEHQPDPLIERRLLEERVRILYGQAPISLMGTALNAVILAVVLSHVIAPVRLILWTCLMLLLVTAIRWGLLESYRRASTQALYARRWANFIILALVCSGILMGLSGVFLFPYKSHTHQAFLALLLGGMMAGAAGSFSVMMEAYLAFSIPAVLPTVIQLLMQPGPIQMAMGGMFLVFVCLMVATAFSLYRTSTKSLRLRFENQDLIGTLTEAKLQSDRMVEALKHEIGERVEAQKALQESEQQFRRLVETLSEGLGMLDENGHISYVNDRLCEILEYARQELLGKPVGDLFESTLRITLDPEILKRTLRRRTSSEMEMITKTGRKLSVIISASPVFDDAHKFRGTIAAITDISILKRAEKSLRESEEKYRTIFNYSPLGIIHFDRHGVVTAHNDTLTRMSDAKPNEFVGMNLVESMSDPDMISAIQDCLEGSPGHYEGYYRSILTEKVTPLKVDYGPVLAEDGTVLGGIGIIEDISGRKRAEKELRDQLHFLQTLIDTIPNPVFYKDTEGRYIGCNKAFEERLGSKREEIVGKTVYDLMAPELAEKYNRLDHELFGEPGEQVFESALLFADGLTHEVMVNRATFTDADGNIAGLVGVNVDITDLKHAEDALRRAHDNLEKRVQERTAALAKANDELLNEIAERQRAEEALRESTEKLKLFAYSVAHDLKSPAVGIYGITKLLHMKYRDLLDERGRTYCDQILKASEHVAALVEEINIYAMAKEAPINIEPIRMSEILRIVYEEFSARLSVRQVGWVQPFDDAEIRADRMSLLRIFRNLVDNALKYGGERLSQIRIGYAESDTHHIISVADDGVGIQREDSERIFGPFQRHRNSRGIEGTGLGLAIVKEMTERHGGEVRVEPGEDCGTTFFVTISKNL